MRQIKLLVGGANYLHYLRTFTYMKKQKMLISSKKKIVYSYENFLKMWLIYMNFFDWYYESRGADKRGRGQIKEEANGEKAKEGWGGGIGEGRKTRMIEQIIVLKMFEKCRKKWSFLFTNKINRFVYSVRKRRKKSCSDLFMLSVIFLSFFFFSSFLSVLQFCWWPVMGGDKLRYSYIWVLSLLSSLVFWLPSSLSSV